MKLDKKTDEELIEIKNNKNDYQSEYYEAALLNLEKRGLISEEIRKKLIDELEKELFSKKKKGDEIREKSLVKLVSGILLLVVGLILTLCKMLNPVTGGIVIFSGLILGGASKIFNSNDV